MKKLARLLTLALPIFVATLTFASCDKNPDNCTHDWGAPTCLEPAQCYKCDTYKSDGKLGNHNYNAATCREPAKCIYCHEYKDDNLGTHSFSSETGCCYYCGISNEVATKENLTNETQTSNDPTSTNQETTANQEVTTHEHRFVYAVTTYATCTEDGVITATCDCGVTFNDVIPADGHAFEDGECFICGETDPNYVADAYTTLAQYVLDNGEYTGEWYYIMGMQDEDNSFYIFSNDDASSLSFVYTSYISSSGQSVYTEVYLNSDSNYKDVYFEIESSSDISCAYGMINGATYSENNLFISNYEYESSYPSLSEKFKEIMQDYIDITLQGVKLFVLPEKYTMDMFGFDNY